MQGIAYGVGVGPGDPELMTIKAVRLIRENEVIAFPARAAGESAELPARVAGESADFLARAAEESTAFRIAAKAVPEIRHKTLLPIYMPMVRDRLKMVKEHQKGAKILEEYLDSGRNIVFLTLGDPTVYCSFSYLQHILEEDGYEVRLVSGVTSFCAAAARMNVPLTEWDEPLHVIPAAHRAEVSRELAGTYVLMKSGSRMKEIKELLTTGEREVFCVENCGMENERVYQGAENIPEDAGYFSTVIAKEK